MRKAFFGKSFYFIERGIFASNCKFSNKNDPFCAWRDFNKKFCGISNSTYHKWMFKLQISSIFHFYWESESWMAHVLGVRWNMNFNVLWTNLLIYLVIVKFETRITSNANFKGVTTGVWRGANSEPGYLPNCINPWRCINPIEAFVNYDKDEKNKTFRSICK